MIFKKKNKMFVNEKKYVRFWCVGRCQFKK